MLLNQNLSGNEENRSLFLRHASRHSHLHIGVMNPTKKITGWHSDRGFRKGVVQLRRHHTARTDQSQSGQAAPGDLRLDFVQQIDDWKRRNLLELIDAKMPG